MVLKQINNSKSPITQTSIGLIDSRISSPPLHTHITFYANFTFETNHAIN